MKNLAGAADCDNYIRDELQRARIEIVEGAPAKGEVPYTVTGKLGAFTFSRAWYYWVVKGPMPLAVARELYADPIGVKDVRVAGHCGCPAPDGWADHFDAQGRKILDRKDETALRLVVAETGIESFRSMCLESIDAHSFADDPAAVAVRSEVTSYHIDSGEGLRLFADTVRALPVRP